LRWNGTGERRKRIAADLCGSQASSGVSKAKQCGQAKLKNSTTSTAPGGAATGTGGAIVV